MRCCVDMHRGQAAKPFVFQTESDFEKYRRMLTCAHSLCLFGMQPWWQGLTDLLEVLFGVGVHEELVKFVSDAAAVLNGRHHVAYCLPCWSASSLRIHLQQMVLQDTPPKSSVEAVLLPEPCSFDIHLEAFNSAYRTPHDSARSVGWFFDDIHC